jgi:hypothetical protein
MAVSCVNEWAGGLYDGTVKLVEIPGHGIPVLALRHELLHAVALSDLPSGRPLWFTEGVADTFASPARQHTKVEQLMLRNQTAIPVSSLVDTLQVLDAPDAELSYAESDALVAMLLDARGPQVIHDALEYLRHGGDPTQLDAQLLGHPITVEELLAFLARDARGR